MKKLLCLYILLVHIEAFSQPGTANLSPTQSLNLRSVAVEVPEKFKAQFPGDKKLNLPPGYKVRLYHYGGLTKPRFMSFDGKGVLHVADLTAGKAYALPDKNNDAIADTIYAAADQFNVSHDVKFYKGAMYVTNQTRVWKLLDNNDDGIYETRSIFIDSIAYGSPNPLGGHTTRTLVFDSVHAKAYLSIGSLCNVCREDYRAVIESYNDDGSGKQIFATGIRNAVGMAIQPNTRKLWANNNGSDRQGNETPPEWIDIIRENGFYGYPFAYGNQKWFDFNAHSDYQALLPITLNDSLKVSRMIQPAALIRAHMAPMALAFFNESFPVTFKHGMITALRGSWNAPQNHRGYNLYYLHLSNESDSTVDYVAEFANGFLEDSVNRLYWGRPVGIALNNRGEIFVSSDDAYTCILQIYPEFPTGMELPESLPQIEIYPNPTNGLIQIGGAESVKSISIIDVLGKECHYTLNNKQIDIKNLETGMYYMCIQLSDGNKLYKRVIKR